MLNASFERMIAHLNVCDPMLKTSHAGAMMGGRAKAVVRSFASQMEQQFGGAPSYPNRGGVSQMRRKDTLCPGPSSKRDPTSESFRVSLGFNGARSAPWVIILQI